RQRVSVGARARLQAPSVGSLGDHLHLERELAGPRDEPGGLDRRRAGGQEHADPREAMEAHRSILRARARTSKARAAFETNAASAPKGARRAVMPPMGA